MKPGAEFKALDLPKKGVAPCTNRYRVYKDAKEFSVVEAASALEALQASGLTKAHRIERDSIMANNLIDLKKLEEMAPPAAAAAAPAEAAPAAPVEAAKPAEAAAPAAEPAKPGDTDKKLSGEDVDKLLKPGT